MNDFKSKIHTTLNVSLFFIEKLAAIDDVNWKTFFTSDPIFRQSLIRRTGRTVSFLFPRSYQLATFGLNNR